MTRERFAEIIRWHKIVWVAGIVNPFMILPQLWQIWETRQVADISLSFLFTLVALQAAFSVHGFFIRDKMVNRSNGLAAGTTAIVIASVLYLN